MAEYISTLTGQQMDSAMLDMAQHNSEAWAVGKRNGVDVTQGDVTYQNNAKYYAGHISEAGHPPYIGTNGNWYEWDSTEVAYVDTEVQAEGENGNGIVSITKTSTSGLVDTYTILFSDATTTTFNITNGSALSAYPVGSVYFSTSNADPATVLGGGTWSQLSTSLSNIYAFERTA